MPPPAQPQLTLAKPEISTPRSQMGEMLAAPIRGSDLETAALSKLFFLGLLPDAAARRAVLDGIVVRASADLGALESVDAELDAVEVPPQFAEVFRYQRATLAYGLGSHRLGRDFFAALRDAEG